VEEIVGVCALASLTSTHAIAASEKDAIKKCDIDAFREFTHADKATKLQAIIDFGKCIKTQNKSVVGSYLCHVENRVGVIVKGDNGTSVNLTPPKSEQTFHLNIAEVSDEKKRQNCAVLTEEFGLEDFIGRYANNCLVNYDVEGPGFIRSSTDGVHTFDSQMSFSLFGNKFVYYYFSDVGMGETASQSESPFVDRGTCEKMN
jgi:hypothetical protein